MDLGVRGKGFLIVGGTAGMGLATARVLAAEGADLVLVGRDAGRCRAASDELAQVHGVTVAPVVADVSRPGEADRVVQEASAGVADLAGVAVFTGLSGHEPVAAEDAVWEEAFQDVLMGTVRVLRQVLPLLVARGAGTVVTTSAYSVRDPKAERMPYGAMKASIVVLTKGIAKAYGQHGIRANCLAPGVVETEALTAIRGQVAEAQGLPYDTALEQLMAGAWGMDVALGRPGGGGGARRVPAVRSCGLPDRRAAEHRRRHRLLTGGLRLPPSLTGAPLRPMRWP